MCRRRGHLYSRTAHTRPSPVSQCTQTSETTEPPDPTKSRYEVFCALCGLGLIYRVRFANSALLGLPNPKPLEGRVRRVEGRMSQCWSRNAIGIELDPTTRTISETTQVSVPYVPHLNECSQTVYGHHIESIIAGRCIFASKPTRSVPIPPGFAPSFNWDTGTASPVAGPSRAGTTDTANPPPTQSAEKVTYLIHGRCYEILRFSWARENIPWGLRGEDLPVGLQDIVSQSRSGYGVESTHHLDVLAASPEGLLGTRPLAAVADITSSTDTYTTTRAPNTSLNKNHLLPALFTALHSLGRKPGKNYWSQKDCEFDSEADFPGLAESMNSNGCNSRHVSDPDAARNTALDTTPQLGIVCSRDMWPHLNPHNVQDEFCPGIDYTGAALVAVADPIKEVPGIRELLKLTSPAIFSGSQQISIFPSPPTVDGTIFTSTTTFSLPSTDNEPPLNPSPSAFIWSPPQSPPRPTTRITPRGPSTTTDPFTLLPPELLLQILSYLSLPHISSLRLSSRYLASFIHPTSELPKSYFRDAFGPGGEFEFLLGLSVSIPSLVGEAQDFMVMPERGGGGVDWKALYRRVQYLLEVNPEAATGKIENGSYVGTEWVEQQLGRVVVPRSPGLANRRRIWGIAVKVAKETRRLMEKWAGGGGEDKRCI
ncbi:hypothetical protein L211DRAFT_870068 [Terfezia boudieri ATCC MYA-4762]|uniref:F-box domain-containing protein n=1 Tax=Terfezia boudieri ATCC MYA-4762 TaxID=1051890 RepID=A0A3N4LIV7_9PEZI|nr:hypothetical protein L211DRAFT_870068 [Terfezia boudieri ATCC MYA-4762]